MRRFYVLIIILMISSLACGLFATVTPKPTSTSLPPIATTEAVSQFTPTTVSTSSPIGTAETTTSPTQEEPTKTPYPTSVLDPTLNNEINTIETQVVTERQLQPKHTVPFVLLSTDQLRQNVISDYDADHTDEDIKDEILQDTILGWIEPGLDLRQLDIDLQSEQIAGYYDPETGEMFVVQSQGFQGPERLTYSHEYTHVLQDQNYDIEHGLNYNDDTCEADSEYCAAVQALFEGDATLSESAWYYFFSTQQDKDQIDAFQKSLKTPVYDSAPAFMKDDLMFPYTQGLAFVQALFEKGGWAAVDALYHNPPVSTEQILHPDLYPADKPIHTVLPDIIPALGTGWREVVRDQMGEWSTYLILARGINENARLDDKTAQAAAAGWGGDAYLVLHNDSANTTVFVLLTKWDTTNDASEFSTALQKYANARFGVKAARQGATYSWAYTQGYSSFYSSGDTTIWIIAPDAATAQTISGLVQP